MTQNVIAADRDETVIIYFTKRSGFLIKKEKKKNTTHCYVHRLQLIINYHNVYVQYFFS